MHLTKLELYPTAISVISGCTHEISRLSADRRQRQVGQVPHQPVSLHVHPRRVHGRSEEVCGLVSVQRRSENRQPGRVLPGQVEYPSAEAGERQAREKYFLFAPSCLIPGSGARSLLFLPLALSLEPASSAAPHGDVPYAGASQICDAWW